MNKLSRSLFVLPLILWACSDTGVAPNTCPNFGSQGPALGVAEDFMLVAGSLGEDWRAVNLSGPAPVVLPEFGLTGVAPNDIDVVGNQMFVVNSGDNTITRIDLETGANSGCIETGAGSNPWELFVDPQDATRGWITTLVTGELMELDLANMRILRQITVEPGLEGLLVTDTHVLVTLTGFDLTTFEYGQGHVVVYEKGDLTTEVAKLPVPLNPQFLLIGADSRVHVICTGNFGFPAPGIFGKVVRLEPDWSAVRDTLDIGGSPNRSTLAPDGTVYLASFFGGVLAYDPSFSPRTPVLTETGFTDVSIFGDHLYAANFDGDKVVRLSLAGTDTLDIPVGNDGPSAIAFREGS